jgi:hypothetical protein
VVLDDPRCETALDRGRRAAVASTVNPTLATSPGQGASAHVRTGRRRRRVLGFGILALVLVCGAVSAAAVAFRYAHARSLVDAGYYGWVEPDNLSSRSVELGRYDGMVTTWRPGARQAFMVGVRNDSPVTQTILGLAGERFMHEAIDVATPGTFGGVNVRYERSLPVAITPHETRVVRFSFTSPRCHPGDALSWDELRVRVRVGWFTRTETIRLANEMFEIKGSAKSC